MAPYRRHPWRGRTLDREHPRAAADERVLGVLLLAVGAPRVAVAVAVHERFGAESTIAAIMIVLGILALASER